jgi:Protein of unknown function (DUF1579)
MQGMPEPREEHRKLSALEGEWGGPERLFPSPWGPGGEATGRMRARMSVDGFFLVQDYEEERNGQVVFRGHGVIGYDAAARNYLWYWFDSMGAPPALPSRGQWDGDTLTFLSEGPGHRSRYTFRFEAPTQYSFKAEGSRDGETWTPFIEASYSRR